MHQIHQVTAWMRTRTGILITSAAVIVATLGIVLPLTLTGNTTPPASAPAATPTAADVASQVGATGFTTMQPTLYASTEGTATWNGKQVDIVTFTSPQLKSSWVNVASQFETILKDGGTWVIAG